MPDNPMPVYTDLLIEIKPKISAEDETPARYPAEATLNHSYNSPIEELLIDVAALQAHTNDAHTYGNELFYALFTGKIRETYDVSLGYANANTNGQLRIRLSIDEGAPELHALAWEYLCQPPLLPLTTVAATPFSRFTELAQMAPKPTSAWPRQMLFAIANPQDLGESYNLAALAVETEVRSLLQSITPHIKTGVLHLSILPGITGLSDSLRAELVALGVTIHAGCTSMTQLAQQLNEQSYHILHFLGHGYFSRRRQKAYLLLEDDAGNAQVISDDVYAQCLMSTQNSPGLVFLSACESARRSTTGNNPFIGIAPQLVLAGAPTVVAMQDFIPININQTLVQNFYRYLLQHGLVDLALNQARQALYTPDSNDWAIPVLFSRLPAGQLFTQDPVRTALNTMEHHEIFNPLPVDTPYLPVEVQHFKGQMGTVPTWTQSEAPAMRLIDAVEKIFAPTKIEYGPYGPSVLVLVGDEGMGKSVSLRHLGYLTAQHSLGPEGTRMVIPVYVDLQDLPAHINIDPQSIEKLILDAMAPFWEDTGQSPADLLQTHNGPTLRIMIDGSDLLPANTRYRAWNALNQFILTQSRHEYIVATNPEGVDIKGHYVSDVLIMQPISRWNLQIFLNQTLRTAGGPKLYAAIETARIFDMAAMPWLLFEMLKQTQRGFPPQSRTQVLRALIEDRTTDIAADRGMRARAIETLNRLAWTMQMQRQTTLPVEDAFEIMAEVRGKRGYDLEILYQEFISHGLLEPVGDESLSFTRTIIRAYCFAEAMRHSPQSKTQLDDITATLGRHNRYRWWEEALILLSGIHKDPMALVRQILYGVPLGEGEQIFLAARCVQEHNRHAALSPQLLNNIINSLVWRLHYSTDPHASRRVRIIQTLASLEHPTIVPTLVEIAYQPHMLHTDEEVDYDYNSVRLAALQALRRIVSPPYTEVQTRAAPLATILSYWHEQQIEALIPYLFTRDDIATQQQAVAAFALGDIKTPRAIQAIIQVYMMPHLKPTVRRNVVSAISLLDAGTVTQKVILPLLDVDSTQDRTAWFPTLAYLIGKVRTQDPTARGFLYRCLREIPAIQVKALALQSLGWLYDTKSKTRFEDIALGDFSSLNLSDNPPLTEKQRQHLQRKALQALRTIGDRMTTHRLQTRTTTWGPEIEQAFYWTIEEIIARENEM